MAKGKKMDLKQLNTFLEVSKSLNFTRAAEQLGYAQSSVTAQIQQLEIELGAILFERIGKKVILTDSGRKVLPYVSQILQLSGSMKDAASSSEFPKGNLSIGTAESLSIYRLPKILEEYRKLYPDVNLELKLMNCEEFLPALSNGIIDVAFSIGDQINSKYIVETVQLQERIRVISSPDPPFRKKKMVRPEDFDGKAIILTGKGCCYRGAFMKKLSKENIVPRIVLETDSIQVIKQAAVSGLGACVLPEVAVAEELEAGKLELVDFDTSDFNIVSQMFYHRDKYISSALSEFLRLSDKILNQQRRD